jgi:hypothetical protein
LLQVSRKSDGKEKSSHAAKSARAAEHTSPLLIHQYIMNIQLKNTIIISARNNRALLIMVSNAMKGTPRVGGSIKN